METPQASRLAVTTDTRFAGHRPPGFHPERPERLAAAKRGLDRTGVPQTDIPARAATREQLARVHADAYLDQLSRALARPGGYLDGDTYYSPGSAEAAWLAAGSACALVDALIDDRADAAALLARPPGHHATADRAMGFCLLNNAAVAAAHARARGLARVAVVDWDVHHGNGTQDIFARDPSVVYVSLHQWPFYPGTGAVSDVGDGEGTGTTVNVPLPAGSDGGTYAAAFERVVLPILTAAAPELIIVSAGFDAHARDPLGGMQLDAGAYRWMAGRVATVARALGHGRVVLVLEGGYDLQGLEDSVAAAIDGLVHPLAVPPLAAAPHDSTAETYLAAARRAQSAHWAGALG